MTWIKEMLTILREVFAEAAKGNVCTHLVKLIELRAYGKHLLDDNWLQTVNQFRKALLFKIHPDKVPFFTARGDHYSTFVHDGAGLVIVEMENITTRYRGTYSNLGIGTRHSSRFIECKKRGSQMLRRPRRLRQGRRRQLKPVSLRKQMSSGPMAEQRP